MCGQSSYLTWTPPQVQQWRASLLWSNIFNTTLWIITTVEGATPPSPACICCRRCWRGSEVEPSTPGQYRCAANSTCSCRNASLAGICCGELFPPRIYGVILYPKELAAEEPARTRFPFHKKGCTWVTLPNWTGFFVSKYMCEQRWKGYNIRNYSEQGGAEGNDAV